VPEASVTVNVPPAASPQINIENKVEFPKRASEKITVNRDYSGKMTGANSETIFEDK